MRKVNCVSVTLLSPVGHPTHLAAAAAAANAERERERERDREQQEKEREKERERELRERDREREREREMRERERDRERTSEYIRGGGQEQPVRPGSRGYLHSPSPSLRTQDVVVQQRPSIFQGKSVITSLMPHTAAAASAPQSSSRYNTAADALAALVDAAASAPQMDVAKVKDNKHERDADMSSSRRPASLPDQQQQEVERQSLQSPYGAMSLPGGKPHPAYSEGPGGGVKEKGPQTKSRIEEELRTHGKTTITAASFIDVIITRQIASDKDSRERGSQSSDSSGSLSSNRYDNSGGGAIEVISPASSPVQPQQDKPDDVQQQQQQPGGTSTESLSISKQAQNT